MIRNSKISVSLLVMIGFLLSFTIMYTYGRSITLVYGAIELVIAIFCYLGYVRYFRKIDVNLRMICLIVICIAYITGIINGDPKSTLLITTSLVMPLYISTLNIAYKGKSSFGIVTIVTTIIIFLAIMYDAFGSFNSNTLGFVGFMGVSIGFLWVRNTKLKLIAIVVVVFGIICAAMSGSRNVAVVGLVCVMLLLLPTYILRNRKIFYFITGTILIYTIFSADIMAWGFSIPEINEFLLNFTSNYSEKAWEMAARVDYLRMIQDHLSQRPILLQLFGTGSLTMHGHNMFYQCVLEFGYFGTVLIYLMFIRIFKFGYILIRNKQDTVVLGCVIALWGNFMLQAADVYLLGAESYAIVPQVLMGIILQRYAIYRKELVQTYQVDENATSEMPC